MDVPNFEIKDFIGVFPDAVDPNFCDFLCQYVDQTSQVSDRNYTHVKDKQICLDAFSPGEAKGLMEYVNGCLYYYINEFSYLSGKITRINPNSLHNLILFLSILYYYYYYYYYYYLFYNIK